MGMRKIRVELINTDMYQMWVNDVLSGMPISATPAHGAIVVYDDNPTIVPWSAILTCFTDGSYTTSSYIGDVKITEDLFITGCTLRVNILRGISPKYSRWSLFDDKRSEEI